MDTMLQIVAGLLAGMVLWTLLEYVLHRWAFHGRKLGRAVAREHLEHHAKVDYFAPVWAKVAMAAPALALIAALGSAVAAWFGAALTLGTFASWLVYEWIHRRIHVAAPKTAYAVWARRHHLSHHFGLAHANHGVTTPLWDHVFGTYVEPEVIRVPRRFAAKFPWLCEDHDGALAVRAPYAAHYVLS
jgi:sterol desaturase/sphingolipid hydroxylase (fatty acid hydroxylase superfamily)